MYVHHTLLATGIDDTTGELQGQGTSFPTAIEVIKVFLAWSWVPAGTALGIRLFKGNDFLFEETHAVVRVAGEQKPEESVARDVGYVMPLEWKGGWPSGTYRLEVEYNGAPDEQVEFVVGSDPVPGTVVGAGEQSGPIPYKDPSEVLVVTRASVLRANMGAAADQVLQAAALVGDLHDLDEGGVARDTPEAAAALVQDLLRTARYRYLLIVGNDDAVPFFHVNNPIAARETAELSYWQLPADWMPSDDPYTDLNNDALHVPDYATARIPSSDDPELLLKQLGTNTPPDGHGYALINQKRRSEGGAVIAEMNTGTAVDLNYAPPTTTDEFNGGHGPTSRYLYMLLHGIGTKTYSWSADIEEWFPEDTVKPDLHEWVLIRDRTDAAVTLAGNPGSTGLVSIGACYGAWTLDTIQEPTHKTADNSLALYYLKSGTRAFVADTHLSYSWALAPGTTPAGRTGFEMVYWRSIFEGMAPIDAFQQAKIETAAAVNVLAQTDGPLAAKITEKTIHYMIYLGRP